MSVISMAAEVAAMVEVMAARYGRVYKVASAFDPNNGRLQITLTHPPKVTSVTIRARFGIKVEGAITQTITRMVPLIHIGLDAAAFEPPMQWNADPSGIHDAADMVHLAADMVPPVRAMMEQWAGATCADTALWDCWTRLGIRQEFTTFPPPGWWRLGIDSITPDRASLSLTGPRGTRFSGLHYQERVDEILGAMLVPYSEVAAPQVSKDKDYVVITASFHPGYDGRAGRDLFW